MNRILTLIVGFLFLFPFSGKSYSIAPNEETWSSVFADLKTNQEEDSVYHNYYEIRNHSGAEVKLKVVALPFQGSDYKEFFLDLPLGDTFILDSIEANQPINYFIYKVDLAEEDPDLIRDIKVMDVKAKRKKYWTWTIINIHHDDQANAKKRKK